VRAPRPNMKLSTVKYLSNARGEILIEGEKVGKLLASAEQHFVFLFELRSRRYSKSFVTSTSAGEGRARIKTSTRPVNKQFDHRMAREARNHCRGPSLVVGNKCTIVADIWSRAPRHAGT
jgi:hypothetical protein